MRIQNRAPPLLTTDMQVRRFRLQALAGELESRKIMKHWTEYVLAVLLAAIAVIALWMYIAYFNS